MADHEDHKEEEETLIEKISDKIHARREDSSSSSSDSEEEKRDKTMSFKAKFRRLFDREQPLHKILGGGKTADILLWRNKKTSAGVIGGATAIWLLFDVLEYHLLTLVCHGLIFALAVLFLWSNASFFIKKSRPNIPAVYISEQPVLEFSSALRIEINRVLAALRDIALGRDLKKFLGVIAGLWILSVLGSCCSFLTIFYTTIVLLHTIPMLYEKNEDEVDAFAEKAMAELKKLYVVFDAKVLRKIPRGPLRDKKMA